MRKKRGVIKSQGEAGTAGALRRYFHGKPYVVLKDVALNQVVEVERAELTPEQFSYYRSASLDFLICHDDDHLTFELALEVDSPLHDNPAQAHKDSVHRGRSPIAARHGPRQRSSPTHADIRLHPQRLLGRKGYFRIASYGQALAGRGVFSAVRRDIQDSSPAYAAWLVSSDLQIWLARHSECLLVAGCRTPH
jgi:hypothetical protein